MAASIPTRARPDWYADPANPAQIRYWNGTEWSVYSLPKPPGWDQVSRPVELPWWQRTWAIVTALVVFAPLGLVALWRRPGLTTPLRAAVSVVAVLFFSAVVWPSGGETPQEATDPPSSQATPSNPAEPTPTAEPSPTPKSKPPKSTVPSVTGLAGKQAERSLAAAGLVAFVAREVPSPRPRGTVMRQLRAVGASLREGTRVGLVVAAPYPLVPGTAGTTVAVATQRLRDAGFQVRVTQQVVTTGTSGIVLSQSPMGSLRVKPHSVVTLVVASVVRPVAPPAPAPNCTPGYTPCLAPATDYDCAGGSGDGPRYTGLVRVTGSDPYDLDADGDGVACES